MLSTALCFVNALNFISKTQDGKLSLPIIQKTAKVLTQLLVTEVSSVLYIGQINVNVVHLPIEEQP